MGEGGAVVEQQPKQNPIGHNPEQSQRLMGFDDKVKALFSGKVGRTDSSIATPSEIQDIDNFLAAPDHFTDKWWEKLYKWMDERDFHGEKYSVAQITFESLDTLPPNARLPHMLGFWASGALHDVQLNEQIMATLENGRISASLRAQIPAQLARHPDIWSLPVILKGYKLFGEPVGQEMRKNIVPLFMSGLAVEEVFNSNRNTLAQLYAEPPADPQTKKSQPKNDAKRPSILSKMSRQFNRFRGGHHLTSAQPVITPEEKTDQAGRRVEIIRDLVRELFPTYEEYYNKEKEFSMQASEKLSHGSSAIDFTKDEHNVIERLARYNSEISNQSYNEWGVGRDFSMLPLDLLERYLSDVRRLKTLPGFENLSTHIMGDGSERGILAPYVALGASSTSWFGREEVSLISIFQHLNELDKSGKLDDRILDEVLTGIDKNLFSDDQIKSVARRNRRILMGYQLSQEVPTIDIKSLLTVPEENVLRDGLETVASIQERDKTTAVALLKALPKFRAFGDKYKVVFDYIKRNRRREDLRKLEAIKHEDHVSEALEIIQLTDSGKRQGERLVKLAISLDAIEELNEALRLGISDVGIVPDLKTSYDNVQNTLKGIFQQLGIANLEEAYKFLPWIKTKDETALKILRGEKVAKVTICKQ
jgi:hypothetical protein